MSPLPKGLVATLAVALGVGLLTSGLAGQPPGEGPYKKIDTLPAGMIDTYKRTFRAGETAVAVVAADVGADPDLQVIDNNGNVIANIQGPRLDFVARWVPLRTDVFYIVVHNRGKTDARYGVAHN